MKTMRKIFFRVLFLEPYIDDITKNSMNISFPELLKNFYQYGYQTLEIDFKF